MKKAVLLCVLVVVLLAAVLGQGIDLNGTWIGQTEIPDAPEPDRVTLILEGKEGTYTGTVSDSMGMAQEAEIQDVEFKDGTLTFHFTIFNGEEYLEVYVTLVLEGNRLSGRWEIDSGESAVLVLEKQ